MVPAKPRLQEGTKVQQLATSFIGKTDNVINGKENSSQVNNISERKCVKPTSLPVPQFKNRVNGRKAGIVTKGKENIGENLNNKKETNKQNGVKKNISKKHRGPSAQNNRQVERRCWDGVIHMKNLERKVENIPEKFTKLSLSVVETLPDRVIDTDKKERDSNAPCKEYARDSYYHLKTLEMANPVRKKYLDGQNTEITSKHRAMVIDWLVGNHEQFDLTEETLFHCINILDHYLQEEAWNNIKEDLQLVGVSSLFLACKMDEILHPSVDKFIWITGDAYTETELLNMEEHIVETLKFNLNLPSSLTFLNHFFMAEKVDDIPQTLAKYIIEISLLDYGQLGNPPSHTAAAALYLSLRLMNPEDPEPWNARLQCYSGLTVGLLTAIYQRMAIVLNQIDGHQNLKATRRKFYSGKYKTEIQTMVKFIKKHIIEQVENDEHEYEEDHNNSNKNDIDNNKNN